MAIPVYFGTAPFGRIDDAKGGYRATSFFHIYYLPLIPLGGIAGAEGKALRAPLHLGSLGLAYFKWIGFLAAAGLTVLAHNAIERPPGAEGFLMGAAGLALLIAVVSSWVWIGDRAATSKAKLMSVVIPLLLVGAALGWATRERLERLAQPVYECLVNRVQHANDLV